MFRSVVYALTVMLVLSSTVKAQESRTAAIALQQEKKATAPAINDSSKAERIFLGVKKTLLDSPSGLYPTFGSVYSGGGLAPGGGYRQYYGDRSFVDLRGLWSIRNYKLAELSTNSPGHAQGRLDLKGRMGWRDATQVAYYGIGMKTSEDDRADYRFQQAYAGGEVAVRPIPWVVFSGQVNYEDNTLRSGLGTRASIEENYTPATAPGLGASPTYLHSVGTAGIDWRPAEGYARSGGLYEVRYHNYSDRSDDAYGFERLEAEIVQHVPILRENWVISLHGLVSSTVHEDDTPPYFLLPSLGSGDTLRAFTSWRFRDRHSMLMQSEFRWIPNRTGIDMAFYYDAGKVTSRRSDLDFHGLKSDVGVEVRFHGPATTPLRMGLAVGNEGWRIVFGGATAF